MLPGELILEYRTRSGLTQNQLAALLGLKSARMVRHWETGVFMPPVERLESLLEIFLVRGVFNRATGHNEAGQIGQAVKNQAETVNQKPELYPAFDLDWFEELLARTTTRTPEAARNDNLPAPPNQLIGRNRELVELTTLLQVNKVRLLTLTGAGGIGKTRLALALAHRLREAYRDGVWLVKLADLDNPELLAQTLAGTLKIKEAPGRSTLESLLDYLYDKSLLLVLDNCEHLRQKCAEICRVLLENCPQLQILATSRETLYLPGETLWQVTGLDLPGSPVQPSGEIISGTAAALFLERTAAARAGFRLAENEVKILSQICQQLDGLPLALELVAAQTRWLSLKQIKERLYKLPLHLSPSADTARQTIRDSLNWSYNLLSVHEQLLFQRLVVFRGSWHLTTVEAVVTGEGLPLEAIPELLLALINKSLVTVEPNLARLPGEETRYRLLEPIRQYGLEKLTETQLFEFSYRHASYYLKILEQTVPRLLGEAQDEWLVRLEQELDNLQAALGWLVNQSATGPHKIAGSLVTPPVELAMRIVSAFWRIWYTRGRFREGFGWLKAVLACSLNETTDNSTQLFAKVLRDAATMAFLLGDYAEARNLFSRSIKLYHDLKDNLGLAAVYNGLGQVLLATGEYAQAILYLEEAVYIFKQAQDLRGRAIATHDLGWVYLQKGEYQTARQISEESLELFRVAADEQGMAHTLNNLGRIASLEGRFREGRLLLEEALNLSYKLGMPLITANCQQDLAEMELLQNRRYERAIPLLQQSLKLFYEMGVTARLATSLERLVISLQLAGEPGLATQLAGTADKLHEILAIPLADSDEAWYKSGLDQLRQTLSEEDFAANWSLGRVLALEKAIDKALTFRLTGENQSNQAENTATSRFGLSSRELEVLKLVAAGQSNARIAANLVISPHTVNSHLTSIYAKLNVVSRAGAIRFALDNSIVSPSSPR